MTTKKTFPILAGMQFTYPGTDKHRMHKIGYYVVQFAWSTDGQLLNERVIKRVLY